MDVWWDGGHGHAPSGSGSLVTPRMIEHPVSAFHTGASHPYPRKLLDVTLSYGAFEHYLECYLPLLVVCKVRDNSDHVLISFRYDGRRFDADNHPRPGTLR